MQNIKFLDKKGTFEIKNPDMANYLYFPIANEAGVMSSVTPNLGGDSKMGQNMFLLEPVSAENLHNNKSSRNFWLHIEGKGAYSCTGKSAKQQSELFSDKKEEVTLKAGIMWQQVERISKEYGLKSTITSFVPCSNEKVELMKVTVQNMGDTHLEFTAFSAVPIYGRSADNIRDHRHVTSLLHRIFVTNCGVVVNPTMNFDERGHQMNHMCYGVFVKDGCGKDPMGAFPVVDDFIGEGGSFENPYVVVKNAEVTAKNGDRIDGYEAVGAMKFAPVCLAPKESISYIVAMGYGDSEEALAADAKKFLCEQCFDDALTNTKIYWDKTINVAYHSGDNTFDNWMHWVNFQPMLRRIYGCSFLPHHDYGKGGRGWRDLWQDCLALLVMNPHGVRQMLVDNFGGVRFDGTNATIIGSGQGEFIADRNNITRVWMDHGAWPFLTTDLYIGRSGDLNLLLESNRYFKDPQVVRGEEKDEKWTPQEGNFMKTASGSVYTGTVLEHLLLQHLTAFYDVGEHNHIKLRGADWNDALDMAKEKGESVAFTALYGGNMAHMAALVQALQSKNGVKTVTLAKEILPLLSDDASLYDDVAKKQTLLYEYCQSVKHTISGETVEVSCEELSENLLHKSTWIQEHIRECEWLTTKEKDHWFNSYYDNHAKAVEGDHENGVRMMITGQVFTIMSETASDDQVREIAKAADKYLYDEAVGGYKLNTNFHEIKSDLGRMFGFAYGSKENGAVFCHMAVMYANSLYSRGFAKEGYRVIHTLYRHCADFEKSHIYPGVPEYISDRGRGLYHYLTGAASWLLLTVLSEMFGIKGELGNLKFQPKLMLEQFDENGKASVETVFDDKPLHITFDNKSKKEYGTYEVSAITINGKAYASNNGTILKEDLAALSDEKTNEIIVTLA